MIRLNPINAFLIALALTLLSSENFAQRQPATGFQSANSYVGGSLDAVNVRNGNVVINLPIASLPSGPGSALGGVATLQYNSKLWKSHQRMHTNFIQGGSQNTELYTSDDLELSEHGGWKTLIGYRTIWTDRRNLERPDPCNLGDQVEKMAYRWKLEMEFPDGSIRQFVPAFAFGQGMNDTRDGYTPVDFNGRQYLAMLQNPDQFGHCSVYEETYPSSGGMTYVSTDGSRLRLFVPYVANQGLTDSVLAQRNWKLYSMDGTTVENLPPDDSTVTQRITDRNGNKIEIKNSDIVDQFGRHAGIGFNGANLTFGVTMGTRWVHRKYHAVPARPGELIPQNTDLWAEVSQSIPVVDQITLPTQAGGQSYQFDYYADTSNSTSYTNGWGELKSVLLPTGAKITFTYDSAPGTDAETQRVLENKVIDRDLEFDETYDNQTNRVHEHTSYDSGPYGGSSVQPNGVSESEGTYHSLNLPDWKEGLSFTSSSSNGPMVQKYWKHNLPGISSSTSLGYVNGNANAYVKTEYTTIRDSNYQLSLTAIKDFNCDKNGNVTRITEYDWVPYSLIGSQPTTIPLSAVVKRVTVNEYYNQAPDAESTATSSVTYNNASSPKLKNVIKSTEIREVIGANENVVSRTEFYYDDFNNKGNLLEKRSWDNWKGGSAKSLNSPDPTNGSRLDSGNSVSTFATYDSNGNLATTTDANVNVTQITYGDITGPAGTVNGLYPTKTIAAYGTNIARTSMSTFDFYSGAVLTTTDVDNGLVNKGEYDDLARPIKSISAYGSPLESWTRTSYDDASRRVVVRSDVEAVGDGKKVTIQHFDQLGRIRLSRSLENPSDDPVDEAKGIKVQTRYRAGNPDSYQLTSNPYRAATLSAATDSTMGWTRATSNSYGLHSEVETFSGATSPSPWGNNSSSTGKVVTDLDGQYTTVTDQAGKKRRAVLNSLAQLVRVDEPDSNNSLGLASSPTQPTSYAFDVLGNMTTVSQGGQTRSFTYSSLSRLNSSANPESGMVTSTFDAVGNVITQRDARGVKTIFDYDALGRITKKCFRIIGAGSLGATNCASAGSETLEPNTSDVIFTYDDPSISLAKGKLTKVENGVSVTQYLGFDVNGNVTSHKERIDGADYSTAYTHNLSGELLEETYPSGRIVKNTYNRDGSLLQIQSKKNASQGLLTYVGNLSYSPSGRVTSMRLGNNAWESVQLNSRFQPTQIAVGTTQNAVDLWKINYEFGELQSSGSVDGTKNNSNIGKQTVTVPTIGTVAGFTASQTFTYDSLKRIKTATEMVGTNQSWKQTFNYDQFGNRTFDTSNTTTIPSTCATDVCNPGISTTTNRINSTGYTFDDTGNLTQTADNNKFVYDASNKIVELRNASTNALISKNYYDGDGSRVKIEENGVTTVFVQDAFGKDIAEYTLNGPSNQSPKVNYLSNDLLGTPRVITDENRKVISRRDMTPFGEEIAATTGGRNTNQGYSGGMADVSQKFTGQRRDELARLDYFNARHYAYSIGRFMSADNFGGKLSNPQSLNLYAYALNNPLKWVDPTGHFVDNPIDCVKDGVEQCTADQNGSNMATKPNGASYQLNNEIVNISCNCSDENQNRREQAPPPDLADGPIDLVPILGSGRRMLYNMSCHDGGGCNIDRAVGNFIHTSIDAATLVEGFLKIGARLFAKEVAEETTEVGATKFIRNSAEEAPSSLFDDSITNSGSIRNIQTDVTPNTFISNLEKNGFSRSVSKDGLVSNMEKGSFKYSVRGKSVGQKPPSVNVFKNGTNTHKVRLKP